jgi:hypothetical protein
MKPVASDDLHDVYIIAFCTISGLLIMVLIAMIIKSRSQKTPKLANITPSIRSRFGKLDTAPKPVTKQVTNPLGKVSTPELLKMTEGRWAQGSRTQSHDGITLTRG